MAVGLKLEQFGGMLPGWDAGLLPPGQASYSKNGYLFSGALLGWRKPKILRPMDDTDARFVYRIPTVTRGQARSILVFKAQPNNGDVIQIHDTVYTFRSPITHPFDVKIGANISETARNLVSAISCDANSFTFSGERYSDSTYPHADLKWYKPGTEIIPGLIECFQSNQVISGTAYNIVVIGARDFGTSYNTFTVTETTSGARLLWIDDLGSLSHVSNTLVGGINPSFDPAITSPSTWLEIDDPDTTVVKSPIVDDQYERIYISSPTVPPRYTTRTMVENSEPLLRLGVPLPGAAPAVEVTGGGNDRNLGYPTASAAGSNAGGANKIFLTKVTPPGDSLLRNVVFYSYSTNASAEYAAVVYDDSGGTPGDLLGVGEIVHGVAPGAGGSVFSNPIALHNNEPYWIGICTSADFNLKTASVNDGNSASFNNTFTNGPPLTAPAGITTTLPTIAFYGQIISDDVLESRAYTYTWVTSFEEEGPPAPPTVVNGWSNGVWKVDVFHPSFSEMGGDRRITKINIYRTIPGEAGKTVFFFVDSIVADPTKGYISTTFTDTQPNDEVALHDQLITTNWLPPQAKLQGFTALPNGMIAAFAGNEVWFCEPFRPHAWPPGYVLTTDTPIIGLGVTGGTLVVCTKGNPYVMQGISPSQMAQARCVQSAPCISQASIVSDDAAVFYMSPNGLIQVTAQGQAVNTTDLWITRENWQQFTPQKYPRAIHLSSCYFCLGSVSRDLTDNSEATQGFTIELAADAAGFSIWPQPGGHRLGFQFLDSPVKSGSTPVDTSNLLLDTWSGVGLVVNLGFIWYFDFSDPEPEYQPYVWRSKIYQGNVKANYAAIKPFFTIPSTTPALNPTRLSAVATDPVWDVLAPDRYAYIKTYADYDGTGEMILVDAREIRKPGELLRIVNGFKADSWQWEITGQVKIHEVQIGTSVKALGKV